MPTTPALQHVPSECFQGQELVRIGADSDYLLLAPAHGGRLVRWVHRGEDVLYWPDNADWSRAAKIRGGNPLLFPFIGRHFVDGQPGRWRAPDGVVRELPQHGFARDLPFALSACGDTAASMVLASSDATLADYPYAFVFTVTYRLLDDGLEATLQTRNVGEVALPCYPGHHFYFAVPHAMRPACTLALPPADRVRQAPDGVLVAAGRGNANYRLDDARLQDTFHVPRESGPVRLTLPPAAGGRARTVTIALDCAGSVPWHAVTTWTERDDADFYCVEPWVGLPDAIHNGQGLRWIEPGQAEAATCRILVAPA